MILLLEILLETVLGNLLEALSDVDIENILEVLLLCCADFWLSDALRLVAWEATAQMLPISLILEGVKIYQDETSLVIDGTRAPVHADKLRHCCERYPTVPRHWRLNVVVRNIIEHITWYLLDQKYWDQYRTKYRDMRWDGILFQIIIFIIILFYC